jgi:hypothetical protein
MLEPGSHYSFDNGGGTWRVSYEAEQHLTPLGPGGVPGLLDPMRPRQASAIWDRLAQPCSKEIRAKTLSKEFITSRRLSEELMGLAFSSVGYGVTRPRAP